MGGFWVLIPGCSSDEAGEGGGAKGPASGRGGTSQLPQSSDQVCQRKGGSMPGSLGDSWERRRRAKHQALRATQMQHLCSCERYADREKVEAQAEDDIRILCPWRGAGGCNIPQLAECKRNLSLQRLRTFTGHLEDQISAPPKTMQVQPALCQLRAWGGRLPGAPSTGSLICTTRRNCGICHR